MNLFTEACPSAGFPALDQLSWSDDGSMVTLETVRRLLLASVLPEAFASWLVARSREQLEQIADRSLERTTHYKWFLGARPGKYTVWLHEYKSPELFARAMDFAASVHNHRYGFCSCVLSGALHVSEFIIGGPGEPIELSGTRTLRQGETMILSQEDVHRVDRVEPYTFTLLVQGPPARNFSTCYDVPSGRGRRVYDLQSRLPETIEALTTGSRGLCHKL